MSDRRYIGITGNYRLYKVHSGTEGVPLEEIKRVADDRGIYFRNDNDAYQCFEGNFPEYEVEIQPCTKKYPYKYKKYKQGYMRCLKVTLTLGAEEAIIVLIKV